MAEIIELPTLQLRQGRSEDVTAAAALLHQAWHRAYGTRLPPELVAQRTPALFEATLRPRIERAWLAWLGPRLVGYMSLQANCVDELWIAPSHLRRGIGSRLLAQALEAFRAAGYQGVQAGCEDFNQAACGFFEHHGWQVIASEPQPLTPALTVQALVYSRRLGAA